MRFLADENVDREIVVELRSRGHEVAYVAEMEPGISGDKLLSLANGKKVILITADKDFGEIVFRQRRATAGGKFMTAMGDWWRSTTSIPPTVVTKRFNSH